MNILSIGNSFSQDAQRYLHRIARADKVELNTFNLYIGGCPLSLHYQNILSEERRYTLEMNGSSTGFYVSLKEALLNRDWDIVTIQQVSAQSPYYDTYQPYLDNVMKYVMEKVPSAEFLLQETWAYESDSMHSGFCTYHQNQQEMYEKLSEAYKAVAKDCGVRLIPCGDVIQALRKKSPFLYGHGGMSICRDGFHVNVIYGRYLLAAVWYKTLTGNSICNNTYIPYTKLAPNAICDAKVLRVVKETVDKMM